MAKQILYRSIDALKPLEKVISEAKSALSDNERTQSGDAHLNETLISAGAVGTGGAISFAGLYFGGTITGLSAAGVTSGLAAAGGIVGGGMVAGIAVLAAPAVALGVGGYAYASRRNKRKLLEKKEMLLQEAQRKHQAIIEELSKKSQQTDERVNYLTQLNTLLQAAISDLQGDLQAAA